jgi:hypothetical protein
VSRLRPRAQCPADVLGTEAFSGLLESGEDLAVTRREWLGWPGAVLGGQFQHGLAGDLEAFQGSLGSGELLGEAGDLLTQLLGCLAYGLLPGLDPGFRR